MKKILLPIFALVAMVFAACGGDDTAPAKIAVTGISLDKTSLALEIGEEATVKATVEPAKASNKKVEWSIADATIASVNNGVVKGVAVGETTLTAKTVDGNFTATIPVKVVTEKVPVEEIGMIYPLVIKEGQEGKITIGFSPTNATNTNVTITLSAPDVLSIEYKGNNQNPMFPSSWPCYTVKGLKGGKCNVKAVSEDGGFEYECTVTVVEDTTVKVTEIKIGPENASIEVGETKQFAAAISPSDADNKEVEWSSSDTSVATVDANGLVTGIAVGEATITATAKDGSGVKGTALIEVTGVVPTSVTYNGSKNIDIVTWHGKKLEIVVDMEPAGADLRKLNWNNNLHTPHNPVEYSIEADRLVFESEPLGRYPYQFESCQHCIAYSTSADYVFQIFARFRTKCQISHSANGMNSDGSINFDASWNLIQIGLDGDEVAPALAMTMNAGTHYFVAWCPPSGQRPSSVAGIYYPDAYIPTTEYTLTSDNAKWKVERVNDKLYKINDLDPTAYKEVVLTYTCGDFTFDQKFKVVPQ